jgi:Paraquat-inducible protein A
VRFYHVVRFIRRWSMIDIFVESLLPRWSAFGSMTTIGPEVGTLALPRCRGHAPRPADACEKPRSLPVGAIRLPVGDFGILGRFLLPAALPLNYRTLYGESPSATLRQRHGELRYLALSGYA